MSSESMNRWLPCQGYCEMAGSANFFLSLSRCAVLVHGPQWCSSIAAAEMAGIEKKYEKQFYCSEVRQQNLVFGAADELTEALHEIADEQHPALIALLTSCAMSLIGDDMEGICRAAGITAPVVSLDSGGLRGQFMTGYERGLVRFLETLPLKEEEKEERTVNIIGWSTAYPLWEGNLREIRRLLSLVGIRVNVVLGEDGLTLEKAAKLKKASLNLVLYSELGEKAAQWLKENENMDYAILPVPYGLGETRKWLAKAAALLGMAPDFSEIDRETGRRQEQIDLAVIRLKWNNRILRFGDIYACLTEGMAEGLIPALQEEFPDPGDIHLRIEGPGEGNIEGTIPWEPFEPVNVAKGELALVLGNSNIRNEAANYSRCIYRNFLMPRVNLSVPEKCYVGIKGWQYFLSDIIADFYTLAYMNRKE